VTNNSRRMFIGEKADRPDVDATFFGDCVAGPLPLETGCMRDL